jgi:pimeloyl-ACP methyl ester carboxylesterase
MLTEGDLQLDDGRRLHYYDTGTPGGSAAGAGAGLPVFWLHGSPNLGSPPEPLLGAAAENGLRWVSYDRPGYGGSSPRPDRDVASAASDIASIADAIGAERFGVLGHSGGGPHALACGALLADRVAGVVCVSSPAPPAAPGLDWFAGWSTSGVGEQRAAAAGRAELEQYLATAEFDEDTFIPADGQALMGRWAWLAGVAGAAMEQGPEGLIEDLLASAKPWGFDPADLTVPVLVMHGSADRMVPAAHSEWIATRCPSAELRLVPAGGHITVLDEVPGALAWLRDQLADRP